MCLDVVAILLLNVMKVFSVCDGALSNGHQQLYSHIIFFIETMMVLFTASN